MLFRESEIGAIEAILFMSQTPLSTTQLADMLQMAADDVSELLEELAERYTHPASGLALVRVEEGYRLGTKGEYASYIEQMYKPPAQSLSGAALEVLSIIAYKQPVTRGEIEFLRGVQSDRALATLVDRELVKEVGRKDGPGRPILYGTTEHFLVHFGLASISQLPALSMPEREEEVEDDEAGGDKVTAEKLEEENLLEESKDQGNIVQENSGQENNKQENKDQDNNEQEDLKEENSEEAGESEGDTGALDLAD